MSNDYYNKTGNPQSNSAGSSSLIRAEFTAVEAMAGKLAPLATNADKVIVVNSAGTAQDVVARDVLVAGVTHAGASKTTPVDADELPLSDSAASFGFKKLTWANLKATLASWINGGTIPGAFTTLSASSTANLNGATNLGGAGTNDKITISSGAAGTGSFIAGLNNAGAAYAPITLDFGTNFYVRSSGSNIGVFSGTGLAVTGALSASTGNLSPRYFDATNVSGMFVNTTENNHYVNSNLIGAFSSTGLSVTGALSATGVIKAGTTATPSGGSVGVVINNVSGGGIQLTSNNSGGSVMRAITGGGLIISNFTGAVGSESYGADLATLDTSGNLGLGVDPSAWNTFKALQVGATASLSDLGVMSNAYYSTGYKYIAGAAAARYGFNGAEHQWFTAPSGTAGNAITFTQAMTLDASGNLGLGVTPSAWDSTYKALQVSRAGFASDVSSAIVEHGVYYSAGWKYIASGQLVTRYEQYQGSHYWYTAPSGTAGNAVTFTQAMTLDSAGNLSLGVTSPSSYGTFSAYSAAAQPLGHVNAVTSSAWNTPYTATMYIGANRTDLVNNGVNVGYRIKSYGADATTNAVLTIDVASSATGSSNPPNSFTTLLTVDASGNFVVSSSAANTIKLTQGASLSATNSVNTAAFDVGLLGGAADPAAYVYQRASSPLVFGTSNTERMRIDASGNLGLGVTSPNYRLQVQSAGTGTTAASNIVGRFQTNGSGYDVFVQLSDNVANSGGIGMVGGAVYLANGTTRNLTLDSSGNLGLGVPPSAWSTGKAIEVGAGSGFWGYQTGENYLTCNAYYVGAGVFNYVSSFGAGYYEQFRGAHIWGTAPSGTAGDPITFTQAMTLDASGHLRLGAAITDAAFMVSGTPDVYPAIRTYQSATTQQQAIAFDNTNGTCGTITTSGSSVAYNTTSDHRLKTNVRDADAARFMDIQFRDFEWVDGRHDCGVIAHELQAVYPDLVMGAKDATEVRTVEITPAVPAVLDAEGVEVTPAVPAVTEQQTFPVYQQVNYIGLIGRMGTVIQQQQRALAALEARLTAAGL